MTNPIRLRHRAVVTVSGPDAETFLDGLLTVSVAPLAEGARVHGALLTPQGKVIADMLLERSDAGFLLDCDTGQADALVKRLGMFRLRARVEIARRDDLCVAAFTGARDPRSPAAPHRRIVSVNDDADGDAATYHAARIAAGIAEQGVDFATLEVFPADINMDITGGVDFRKGCFVGQEVVSRMKRRGTARRRTLAARVAGTLPPLPCTVLSNGQEIGQLTSAEGDVGLVRIRIDRLSVAADAAALTAGDAQLAILRPAWLDAEIAALNPARETPA